MTGNKQSAWVSAHVYMGSALVIIASLHCGFQFGWNVNTLAYVLMMLVVVSGAFGLYAYLVFPAAITRIRNGQGRQGILKDVRYHALMKAWLYLHVPLSIALLTALVVHIVVVFFYW